MQKKKKNYNIDLRAAKRTMRKKHMPTSVSLFIITNLICFSLPKVFKWLCEVYHT